MFVRECPVSKIQNLYCQKWNCLALFPISTSCILEQFVYSHDRSYLESLFSCIAWENFRLNHRSGEKGRELPLTGRMFCRITQKGPSKKVFGQTNQGLNWGRISTERPKKGRILKLLCCLYFSLMNELETRLFTGFTLKWSKNWSNFEKNERKMSFLQRGWFFLSAAEYFGQSGRII